MYDAGVSEVSVIPGLGGKVQGRVTPAPSVGDGKKEI